MRISIWQQFSSNHSGGFNLIGQFETIEEAEKAYLIIQDMLKTVSDYYAEHPELEEDYQDYRWLTPPEEELAKKHSLSNWERSLDWAAGSGGKLSHYRNLIFLSDYGETWLDAEPFDELLPKFGAIVKIWNNGIDDTKPTVSIRCAAPSEKEAVELVKQLYSSVAYTSEPSLAIRLPDYELVHKGVSKVIGQKVEFRDLPMETYNPEAKTKNEFSRIEEFLPRLISYLESKGCSNFEFSLGEIKFI